jgi:hypothetical protein
MDLLAATDAAATTTIVSGVVPIAIGMNVNFHGFTFYIK